MKTPVAILGIGKHAIQNVLANAQALEVFTTLYLVHYRNTSTFQNTLGYQEMTYQQLLNDKSISIVYNCLPNSLHFQTTIELMNAGKHVLCEKPIALSSKEATEMLRVSLNEKKVLREAFMYLHHPQYKTLDEKLPLIGELQSIHIHFFYHLTHGDDIRLKKEMGGGVFWDVGCYCMHLLSHLGYSNWQHAHAFKRTHCLYNVNSYFQATLIKDSISIHWEVGLEHFREQFLVLKGTRGSLSLSHPFLTKEGQKNTLTLKTLDTPQEIIKHRANQVYHQQLLSFIDEVQKENIQENESILTNSQNMEKLWHIAEEIK